MIKEIESIVCDKKRISPESLHTTGRDKGWISETRQIIMYFARELTPMTCESIAIYYNRDHTTVVHAHRTINNLMSNDKYFREIITDYKNTLIRKLKLGKEVDENIIKLEKLQEEYLSLEKKIFKMKMDIDNMKQQYISYGFTVVNEISKS